MQQDSKFYFERAWIRERFLQEGDALKILETDVRDLKINELAENSENEIRLPYGVRPKNRAKLWKKPA